MARLVPVAAELSRRLTGSARSLLPLPLARISFEESGQSNNTLVAAEGDGRVAARAHYIEEAVDNEAASTKRANGICDFCGVSLGNTAYRCARCHDIHLCQPCFERCVGGDIGEGGPLAEQLALRCSVGGGGHHRWQEYSALRLKIIAYLCGGLLLYQIIASMLSLTTVQDLCPRAAQYIPIILLYGIIGVVLVPLAVILSFTAASYIIVFVVAVWQMFLAPGFMLGVILDPNLSEFACGKEGVDLVIVLVCLQIAASILAWLGLGLATTTIKGEIIDLT